MNKSKELFILVSLQDLDIMLREIAEEEELGFETKGKEKLQKARDELARQLSPSVLHTYQRLSKHYKRVVVPVKDDVCLGCFVKLPTSVGARGKEDITLYRCENCGRFLYWLD